MSTFGLRKRSRRIKLRSAQFALLTVLASVVIAIAASPPQTQNKTIEWSKSPVGSNRETVAPSLQLFRQIDDVQIEQILADGKPVNIGEPFVGRDDNWLKTITIRVKNLSYQHLKTVQLTLILPKLYPGSPQVIYCYGCAEVEREKGIAPGETVELKMPGGDFYNFVVARVAEKTSLSEINKAEISHMYVTPPSGPTSYSGCVKTANPNTPCPYVKP